MYVNGEGIPQDYVKAQKWSNIASARGYADAEKNKDIIEQQITPS